MMALTLLEWTGTGLGLVGSGLLAMNTRHSGWGFVAFLISNACWMGFGALTHAYGLLTMQVGFTLTSAWGVYQWLVVARRRPPVGEYATAAHRKPFSSLADLPIMIKIPITPVHTTTTGGLEAVIESISPASSDCLNGTLKTANGPREVSWNENGLCRDHSPECNLDMSENVHHEAGAVAGALHRFIEEQRKN